MKLSKALAWTVVILGVLGIAFVVLNKKDTPQMEFQNIQETVTPNQRNADDPTYGQELRALTAKLKLTEDNFQKSLQNSAEKEQQFNQTILGLQGQIERLTSSDDKEELQQTIADLRTQIETMNEQKSVINEANNNFESQLSSIAKELESIKKVQADKDQTIASLQQQLQEKANTASIDPNSIEDTVKSILAANKPNEESSSPDPSGQHMATPQAISQNYQPYTGKPQEAQGSGLGTDLASFFEVTSDTKNSSDTQQPAETVLQKSTNIAETVTDISSAPVHETLEPVEPLTVFPVYTLPVTTMLTDSTLLTPLIGRVPFGGNINDPFKFQLEFGAANLAANGHMIPGVHKAIATGLATGNREQSCVRGMVTAMTFIFEDGRIHTVGGGENRSTQGGIGYLADPTGKPCIFGQYINNAGQYLKGRTFAAFLEGLAAAYGQSQISQTENNNGGIRSFVSGNTYQFAAAQGISNSAAEVADYVRERAIDAFDVVYVPQATQVQMIVEQQINIDYNTKSRKINYLNDYQGVSYD